MPVAILIVMSVALVLAMCRVEFGRIVDFARESLGEFYYRWL